MNREDLHQHYSEKRPEIESRLEEFKALREASDKRLFKELVLRYFQLHRVRLRRLGKPQKS
ncbi:hypothetical protein HRED_10282 [Candidatus Haloredivivus sp. G17]|nr:hypothetical protein HRED_10282 [Candidatus Haloredivivus sp. G17]